jgi:hypothetical protein
MCIIGLCLESCPVFDFVLIDNRDEQAGRLSETAALRDGLICGLDLERGGTWMGLNSMTGLRICLGFLSCRQVVTNKHECRPTCLLNELCFQGRGCDASIAGSARVESPA